MQPAPPRRIGRSIGALLAGLFAGVILSLGTDVALHAVGVFPSWGQSMIGYDGPLLLATIYRTVYGVAGSYLAARLAPDRPMLHAMILGVVGLAVSLVGAIVTWNKGPAFGPHWYPVALVVLAIPTAWRAANSASCSCASAPMADGRVRAVRPRKIEAWAILRENLHRLFSSRNLRILLNSIRAA